MKMYPKNKEPKSPVSIERAMEHGLLTIKRLWAGGNPEFERWGGLELDPEPIIIHDLNGQVLFYEFGLMDGGEMIGSIKASASKIIGSTVPTIELGSRVWDPDRSVEAAKKKTKEHFPKAKISETELVCYSYPKIGVRINIEEPETERQSLILDVADLSFVESYGADEIDGFTSWSFYQDEAEPNAMDREKRWELADQELEVVKSETPEVLEPGFKVQELDKLKAILISKPLDWQTYYPKLIPFYSWRVIRFSPRCDTHECFELYGQETSWYCACATGQMILDFYRYYYTQNQLDQAMGTLAPDELYTNHPGGTSNSGQVNGYESLSNNCLEATIDYTAAWSEAKAEIDNNRPLKSGIKGHARACAGWMRQNLYIWPGPGPKRWLKIYDPWPWNTNICAGGKILWEDWDTIDHKNFIYIRHRTTPCT